VGRELKRVAAGQIAGARETLAQRDGAVSRKVHEARSRFKKARTVLLVARRGLGKKSYRRGNRLLREAGRDFRAARDSVALVEALDALGRDCYDGKPPAILRALRRVLAREAKLAGCEVEAGGALDRAERKLRKEHTRVKGWDLDAFDREDARRALQKARKAFLRARDAAGASPIDENMHDWRKRTKILANESALLRKICPLQSKGIETLEMLGRVLGDERDLGLLAQAIKARKEKLGHPAQRRQVLALLARHRKSLCESAFALGTQF
jgi:hypothetical protein